MGLEAPTLSLPLLIGLGLVDSITPCVIGVLLLLLSVLIKTGDRRLILKNGLVYTAAVYATYLIAGLTLLTLFNSVRGISTISSYLYLGMGMLVLIAGILEVKDFFWYGRWFSLSIPKRFVAIVEKKVQTAHLSIVAVAFFGIFVTLIELPCTGAPYLAILSLMSQSGLHYIQALPLLLLYNLIFVLPLIVIITLAYYGIELKHFKVLKEKHRGRTRLLIGLALWAAGIWIVTTIKSAWLVPLIVGLALIFLLMAIVKFISSFGRLKPIPPPLEKPVNITEVIKWNGKRELFSPLKLWQSIFKACVECGVTNEEVLGEITNRALSELEERYAGKAVPTEDIKKTVVSVLQKMNYRTILKNYLLHPYL